MSAFPIQHFPRYPGLTNEEFALVKQVLRERAEQFTGTAPDPVRDRAVALSQKLESLG